MKRSSKKVIVAILLVTMLSQTLYSAAASVFGLGTQSYAYADDEFTEDVEAGAEVDESTQDDADVVQEAPEESYDEEEAYDEEERYVEEDSYTEEAASDDELIDEDTEVVDEEAENDIEEEESEAVPDIRLRASYVDSETGSEIKDTEDLEIDPNYMYILEYEAPEIENYTYNKTTINIEDKDYDITAILTEDKDGTEVYSITTDKNAKDKDADEISWTELVKDAVVVLNYDEVKEDEEEVTDEEEVVSENEADADEETEAEEEEAEPVKRIYEYEDSRVYAKATLERADAIPDDAVFVVKDVTGSSDADEAIEKADEATETNLNKETARVYDIHFENEELGEIEPEEGSVTVEIRFKRNIIRPETDEQAENREISVVHIQDNGEATEVSADVSDTSNGVSNISFDTDSFSFVVVGENEDGTREGYDNTNLNDFLTGVSIVVDGNELSGNDITVKPDSNYEIHLSFAEGGWGDKQLSNDGVWTYTFPDGVTPEAFGDGDITIKLDPNDETKVVEGNISINGQTMTVTMDRSNAENFNKMNNSAQLQFTAYAYVKIDKDASNIQFSDDVSKTFTIDNNSNASISKSGYFDKNDGKMHYTITAGSSGRSTDVVVTDTITGSALYLDQDSIEITSNTGRELSGTLVKNNKGFTYSLSSIENNETVTFKYTASVDFGALTALEGATTRTMQITGNGVTISAKNDEKPGDNTAETTHDISYSPELWKGGKIDDAVSDGKKTIAYTVKLNSDANVSMKGHKIRDVITDDAMSILHYSGNGINIKGYNKNGTLAYEKNVSWATLGVDKNTARSWEYSLDNDEDASNLSYVITYTADADVSHLVNTQEITNTVYDNDNPQSSKIYITPPDGETVEITKKTTTHTSEDISWKVDFNVPSIGLTKAELNDELPNKWVWELSDQCYDSFDRNSLRIEGLLSGESYEVDDLVNSNGRTYAFRITFYKDSGKTQPGLQASSSNRNVTVTYKTKTNQRWVEAATEYWALIHENTARLDYGPSTVQASDKVMYTNASLEKELKGQGNVSIWTQEVGGNVDHYYFEYYVVFPGTPGESVTINDTFDTNLLKFFANPHDRAVELQVYTGAQTGEWGANIESGVYATVEETSTGLKLHVNSLPDSQGFYKIYYYLEVKDADALKRLQQLALDNNGTYTLTNTASIGDGAADTANAVYTNKEVIKKTGTYTTVEGNKTNKIHFDLDVNPNALKLGEEDTITLTDEFTGLTILPTTITSDPVGAVISYRKIDAGYEFEVRNSMAFKLSYDAIASTDSNLKTSWSNVATIEGHRADSSGNETVKRMAEGTAYNPNFVIMKYKSGEPSTTLAGATFQLYDANKKAISGAIFTTGNDGKVEISASDGSGWSLKMNTQYYLKETEAPEGYALTGEFIPFKLDEMLDSAGSDETVYAFGGVLEIPNEEAGSLKIYKSISRTIPGQTNSTFGKDEQDSILNQVSFKVEKLNADGSVDDSFDLDPLRYTGASLSYGTIDNLPYGRYKITEINGDVTGLDLVTSFNSNEVTVYSADETAAATFTVDSRHPDVTLNVANAYTDKATEANVTKVWNDNNSTSRPKSVTVQLYQKIGEQAETAYGDPVVLNATNNWTYKWENLPLYARNSAWVRTLTTYSVKETKIGDEEITTNSDGEETAAGYISTSEEDVATNTTTITNTIGGANLRIHKMVVNDWGQNAVTKGDDAVVNNVVFKITNREDTKFFITLYGKTNDTPTAVDSNGKSYTVTYDGDSHWSILDIPSGTYSVEEIADGVVLGDKKVRPWYTLVTKYAVTTETYTQGKEYGKDAAKYRERSTGGWFANELTGQRDYSDDYTVTVNPNVPTQTMHVLNYYSNAEAEIVVSKEYGSDNNAWSDESFEFEIKGVGSDVDGYLPIPENASSLFVNKDNKSASWKLKFYDETRASQLGTYTYRVNEKFSADLPDVTIGGKTYKLGTNGVLYDPTEYEVDVTVQRNDSPVPIKKSYTNENNEVEEKDSEYFYGVSTVVKYYKITYDEDGNKVRTEVDGITALPYTNLKASDIEYQPWAVKKHEFLSSTDTKNYTYAFNLYEVKKDGTEELKQKNKQVNLKGNNTDGIEFAFDSITYSASDVDIHTYKIKEVVPEGANYSPDRDITFSVQVGYNADGSLYANELDQPEDGTKDQGVRTITNKYELNGIPTVVLTKKLKGRPIKEGENFNVKIYRGDVKEENYIKTVAIPYGNSESTQGVELENDNKYYTREVALKKESVTYSFVEVNSGETINGVTYDKNTYTVTVTPYVEDGAIKFEYVNGDKVEFTNKYSATGGLTLETKKTLNGRALKAEEFTFELSQKSGPKTKVTSPVKVKNQANGEVNFGTISFDLEDVGDYVFEVKEVVPEKAELISEGTYAGRYYKDGIYYDKNNVRTINVTVSDNGDGTLNVAASPEQQAAIKSLAETGFTNDYVEKGKVAFKVTKEMDVWPKDAEFKVYLWKDGENTGKFVTLTEGNPFATFDWIEVDAGTAVAHKYQFKEEDGKLPGVTYDTTGIGNNEYEITWKSDGKGKLVPQYNGQALEETGILQIPTIINSYDASGSFTPKVYKQIDGPEGVEGTFTFVLYKLENGAKVEKDKQTKTIKGSDTVEFAPQQYKLADLGEGNTLSDVYYIEELPPEGVQPDDNGKYVKDGIEYDTASREIDVTVTDNANHNGKLTITSTYNDEDVEDTSGQAARQVTITNKYSAEGKETLNAQKIVKVKTADDEYADVTANLNLDGKFTFTLTPDEKNGLGEIVQEKKTNESGYVTFDELTYTKTGEYFYTIEETGIEDEAKYKKASDNTVKKVKVTVKDDNKDGKMEIVKEYVGVSDGVPEFVNIYEDSIETELKGGKKFLSNAASKDKEFKFILEAKDGDSNDQEISVKVEAGSKEESFKFKKLNYSMADMGALKSKDFYYELYEENAGKTIDGVKNTDDKYLIKVTVAVNNDGSLEVTDRKVHKLTTEEKSTWQTIKDTIFNGGNDEIAFTNTYEPTGELGLTGNKEFSIGAEIAKKAGLTLDGFKFTVTKSGPKVLGVIEIGAETVAEGTSGTDGSIKFDKELSYTVADIGKTYEYTISEDMSGKPGFAAWTDKKFTVEVTDGGKGKLELVVTSEDGVTAANGEEGKINVTFTAKNTPYVTYFDKIDASTDGRLGGATLKLMLGDTLIDEWESSNAESHPVYGLVPGNEYTLTETVVPGKGYVAINATTISINEDGTVDKPATATNGSMVYRDGANANLVIVKDAVRDITLHKIDKTTGESLDDKVKFVVKDEDGKIVSTEGSLILENLATGAMYTVEEAEDGVPFGYTRMNPVKFKRLANGTVEVESGDAEVTNDGFGITIKDEAIEFYIIKYAEDGRTPLPGAKLQVKDAAGNVKLDITSAGEGEKVLVHNMTAGTYTLHEESAPAGYKTAADKTFVIKDDGTIEVDGETLNKINGVYAITMTDYRTTGIGGRKIWEDGNNAQETRPDKIEIRLYRRVKGQTDWETDYQTYTATESNGYTYSFSNVEVTDGVSGLPYEYKVEENTGFVGNVYYDLEESTTSVEVGEINPDESKEYNLKNVIKDNEDVEVEVTKTWDADGSLEGIYDNINVELYRTTTGTITADDKPIDMKKLTAPAEGSNTSTIKFEKLEKYDENGVPYIYIIKEDRDGSAYYWDPADKTETTAEEGRTTKDNSKIELNLKNTHTTLDTEAEIVVKKAVVSNLWNGEQASDDFTFTLYDSDKQPLVQSKSSEDGICKFTSADTKKLIFTEADVKTGAVTFYVREDRTSKTGYTYDVHNVDGELVPYEGDEEYHEVTVNISYDGKDKIVPTVSAGEKNPLEITNKYGTSGNYEFNLSKRVIYKDSDGKETEYWPAGEKFHFDVYDGGTSEGDKIGWIEVSGTRPVSFTTPEYYEEGSHTYYFIEDKTEAEAKKGISYSAVIEPVTITFKDNGEGSLLPYKDGEEDALTEAYVLPTATNYYEASGSIELSGIKTVDQGTVETDGQYNISIKKNDTALDPIPVRKNGDSGEWSYSESFDLTTLLTDMDPATRIATYTYDIEEVKPDTDDGIKYDTAKYQVVVSVSDANRDGSLSITKRVYKDSTEVTGDNALTTLNFTNIKPKPGVATINVTKNVEGANLKDINDGQFSFKLKDEDGIGNVADDGIAPYSKELQGAKYELTFDSDKVAASGKTTFTYTLTEEQPTGEGVTEKTIDGVTYKVKDGFLYDPNAYTVYVDVTYNAETKTYDTEVRYPDGNNSVTFTNKYEAEGKAEITVGKQLVDYYDPEKLAEEGYYKPFSFKLVDPETGDSVTKTIDSNQGTVTFTAEDAYFLKYDIDTLKDGDSYLPSVQRYYYIEEQPSNYGDSYVDDPQNRALVEVTVTDNNDGTLGTSVSVEKTDEAIDNAEGGIKGLFARLRGSSAPTADAWFTNKVKKSGEVGFDGKKLLTYTDGYGLSPEAKAEAVKSFADLQFVVSIKKQDDDSYNKTPIISTGVASDGTISFTDKFDFTDTGIYDITVYEQWKNGTAPEGTNYTLSWTSDKPAAFQIEVKDDDKDGVLEIVSNDVTLKDGRYTLGFECTNLMEVKWYVDKTFYGVTKKLTAHLQLLDSRKKVVYDWPDTTVDAVDADANGRAVKTYELTSEKVRLGETYTLHEVKQPDGYMLADDIKIKIGEDGTYVLNDGDEVKAQSNHIEMINDKPDNTYTSIEITKTWDDPYEDTPEQRPTVYAQIYQSANGGAYTEYGKPVAITRQADGKYLYNSGETLPLRQYVNNAWVDYTYQAKEVVTQEMKDAGYEMKSSEGSYLGSTLTGTDESADTTKVSFINKLEQRYIDIPVKKVWDDGKSVATHPTITFHLLADGKDTGKTVKLPSGQLEGKFTKLEVYDFSAKDKHEIVYTVKEDAVPGYKKAEGVKSADGTWIFTNESIKTKIRKYDANDTSANPTELEGAEFTINKVGGGWSATLKSGQTLEYAIGSAGSGGIVPGDYEMRETKAPYGYARSSVVAHFTVAEDGTVTQTDKWVKSNWNTTDGICFEDKPLYGAFRIIKVDGDTEEPLEGAEFRLYSDRTYKSGSRVLASYIAGEDVVYELDTYKSGSDGKIEIDDLEWGTYYLEEVTAPAGYAIPENNVFIFKVDGTHNTPDSDDYLELHYIANYKDTTSSSSSSSSTTSSSTTSSSSSSSTTSSSSSTPETTEDTTPETPGTPDTGSTSSSSSTRYLTGVLGSRKGGFVSDVLGVKKAPTEGVLGERMSPVTGDDLTLNFWIMVLCAAGLIAMSFVYSDDDEDDEEGGEKKAGRRRLRRAEAEK